MQELIGKIITGVYLSDDDTRIAFTTETGEALTYATGGDCCSESWFSDIIAIHDLLGNQVLEVEEKEEQAAEGTRQGYDIIYGYTLKTVQGRCDVNFRNSSNGYYGGSCYFTGASDEDYSAVPGYRSIREDFPFTEQPGQGQ